MSNWRNKSRFYWQDKELTVSNHLGVLEEKDQKGQYNQFVV